MSKNRRPFSRRNFFRKSAITAAAIGIGSFVTHVGIKATVGQTFAALAISAFALTTLDTATRLARFMFQEFFDEKGPLSVLSSNRYIGTMVTVVAAGALP